MRLMRWDGGLERAALMTPGPNQEKNHLRFLRRQMLGFSSVPNQMPFPGKPDPKPIPLPNPLVPGALGQ